MSISNTYRKLVFRRSELPIWDKVPDPSGKYLRKVCEDNFTTLRLNYWDGNKGAWTNLPWHWYPVNMGGDPDNLPDIPKNDNLILTSDGVRMEVRKHYEPNKPWVKYSVGILSMLLDGNGIYRCLVRMPDVLGLCSAVWLYRGFDPYKGGVIEFDYEHKAEEDNTINVADHHGWTYKPGLIVHSHNNRVVNDCYDYTAEFTWLEFELTPYDVTWKIQGIPVKKIRRYGSTDKIWLIVNCGTQGISDGIVNDNLLPQGMTFKLFQFWQNIFT
jgi:hypothetical protein